MPYWNERMERAVAVAARFHKEQMRKDGQTPYIAHPFAVALVLSKLTDDEDVIIAGLFHDLLEDTAYTEEEMRSSFGERVTTLVLTVTEAKNNGIKKKESWAAVKERYYKQVEAGDEAATLVSAADRYCNLLSFITSLKENGPEILKNFSGVDWQERMAMHRRMLALYKRRITSPLLEELEGVMGEAERYFMKHEA